MKQTLIPEKIKISNVPPENIVVAEYLNSLIDVVTEQQKEIEALKQYRNCHIDWHRDNNPKPYTAMRSTGDGFSKAKDIKPLQRKDVYGYCKCPEPLPCHRHTPAMCSYCSKSIKQKDDVREKLIQLLKDENRISVISGTPITPIELADKILAIVKGE